MKALIINGSPRGRNSNSKVMSDFFEQGLQECGIETENVFLTGLNIKYCQGCFGCWKNPDGKCVIQDDMSVWLNKYIEADYVIFSVPVYFYTMPAIMKNFIDRLLPLATPHIHKNANGEFFHNGRYTKYPTTIVLSNCGFPGNGNFEGIKTAFTFLRPTAVICRNQGELLKEKQEPVNTIIKQYGDLLKQTAIELINNNSISGDLQERLTASLIPDELYVKGANESW